MSIEPYLDAIAAIAELPKQFPISQIPPGISFWISRSEPTLAEQNIATRRNGTVKCYAVTVEFFLHCKAGSSVLELDPHPYILPDGHINTSRFNAEYPKFFRVRRNAAIRRWVSQLDSPLQVFCYITNTLVLVQRLCTESANFAQEGKGAGHLA